MPDTLYSPRVVFMGTPAFAVPSLQALAAHYKLVGVVSQPDRPAGRGRRLQASPVKQAAEALGVPVQTPESLRKRDAFAALAALEPDLIAVAAFGQILKPRVLDLPRYGCINVHASLLPRWRGAAPINAAILAGDTETGVTIMRMDEGLDTGDMLSKRAVPILDEDSTERLTEKLADLGAELLIDTLPGWLSGELVPVPQDDTLATYAPQLKKEDGRLDLSEPAPALARRVRAMQPWPGAFAIYKAHPLKVLSATAVAGSAPPGLVEKRGKQITVGTGDGLLVLDEIQPAGKNPMAASAYANGDRDFIGVTLT